MRSWRAFRAYAFVTRPVTPFTQLLRPFFLVCWPEIETEILGRKRLQIVAQEYIGDFVDHDCKKSNAQVTKVLK